MLRDRFSFFEYPNSHMLAYLVPGEHEAIEPGKRICAACRCTRSVAWVLPHDRAPARYGGRVARRAYARRGAAAVLIEDKVWPRPLGHGGAKLVIEREAALLRCRAAAEACREKGILLLDDPGYFPASDGGASARGSQSSTVVPSPTLLRIRIAPRD